MFARLMSCVDTIHSEIMNSSTVASLHFAVELRGVGSHLKFNQVNGNVFETPTKYKVTSVSAKRNAAAGNVVRLTFA